jgi:hypothetical protein
MISMKPGDLVTVRTWNLTHTAMMDHISVYESPSFEGSFSDPVQWWRWHPGEIGILLDGKDELEGMVQVLVDGKVGWVDEEYVRTIDEAR